MDIYSVIRGIIGTIVILGIAFLFSNNKKRINWRLVGMGLVIQFVFAVFILLSEPLQNIFYPLGFPKVVIEWLGEAVVHLLDFTIEGAKFVFGKLAVSNGPESLGFYFAFQVLPTIIFVSSLTSVLYYLGILQRVVQGMAWIMAKLMGTSGAESLSCTAEIFVGQTESPLFIRPYLSTLSQSELLTIMIGGMATIAGGVMAAYIQMLGQSFAEVQKLDINVAQVKFAVQILAASTMAAPAALLIGKILYPEVEESMTKGTVKIKVEKQTANVIEAAAGGASDGLQLALNVGAMLLVFIAFITMINYLLQSLGNITGINSILMSNFGQLLSMQLIFGLVLQYLAFAIGVPWSDALIFGSLLGTKVTLNEFVAYLDLAKFIQQGMLTEKGITMATFALCGFANFSSIAIQIGGISPLVPHRRKDIAALGLRAVLGGTLATLLTATIAGTLLG